MLSGSITLKDGLHGYEDQVTGTFVTVVKEDEAIVVFGRDQYVLFQDANDPSTYGGCFAIKGLDIVITFDKNTRVLDYSVFEDVPVLPVSETPF